MKAVSVEHVQINLKDFLSKLGIDFKEDCKIESVFLTACQMNF